MIDWHAAFVPTVSLLELFLRGSAVYLLIVFCFRIFRRPAGGISTTDIVVVVLVADAAQNAMAAEYHSITEGAFLVLTIVFWNYALDWLSFRYPWAYRLLHAAPALLVRDGRIQGRNLRAEMLTRAELDEFLREQGVEDVSEVKRCYLEADGQLSVIKRDEGDSQGKRRPKAFT
jgi:uncharacterized membrane protein YcaP (DUF421 family)